MPREYAVHRIVSRGPTRASRVRRFAYAALTLLLCPLLTISCANVNDGQQDDIEEPVALVYRGPASCEGCSETLAERLSGPPLNLTVRFIGPNEATPLEAPSFAEVDLYAQPGGDDDVFAAAEELPPHFARALRDFITTGGSYLGVCMGAYLAGEAGFGLLDSAIEGESGVSGFPVTDSSDRMVRVTWGNEPRWTYFQEGARLPEGADQAFAHYETGDVAAAIYRVGDGRVGLIGPHPEADASWRDAAGLDDLDGDDWSYALPLVEQLLP